MPNTNHAFPMLCVQTDDETPGAVTSMRSSNSPFCTNVIDDWFSPAGIVQPARAPVLVRRAPAHFIVPPAVARRQISSQRIFCRPFVCRRFRCGRQSHMSPDCYASTTVDGKRLTKRNARWHHWRRD